MTVKDFVDQENQAFFSYYRAGVMYYMVHPIVTSDLYDITGRTIYCFPIPVNDLGGATVSHTEKAVTLMRWIRLGIEEGTMIREEQTL